MSDGSPTRPPRAANRLMRGLVGVRAGGMLGSAGVYVLANTASAGIPFLLLPFLTRVLTPSEYGTAAMFVLTVSIAASFTGMSIQASIATRYFHVDAEELAEYIGVCFALLVTGTTLASALAVALGQPLSALTGLPVDWIVLAVVTSGVLVLLNVRLALWVSEGRAGHYATVQVGQSLLNASASLGLVLIAGLAWQGRALGHTLAILLAGGFCLLLLVREGRVRRAPNWQEPARQALRFGVPLIPHTVGAFMIFAADRFIVNHELGSQSVGIYMVATQMGQVLGLVTEGFNRAYAPWLMQRLSGRSALDPVRVVRSSYAYCLVILVGSVVFALVSPLILGLIAGPAFQVAASTMWFICLGFAASGWYYMVTNYVFFENRTGALALTLVVAGLVNVGVTLSLVNRWGINGAAAGFMTSQIVAFIGTWVLAQRVHPMPWAQALRPRN